MWWGCILKFIIVGFLCVQILNFEHQQKCLRTAVLSEVESTDTTLILSRSVHPSIHPASLPFINNPVIFFFFFFFFFYRKFTATLYKTNQKIPCCRARVYEVIYYFESWVRSWLSAWNLWLVTHSKWTLFYVAFSVDGFETDGRRLIEILRSKENARKTKENCRPNVKISSISVMCPTLPPLYTKKRGESRKV